MIWPCCIFEAMSGLSLVGMSGSYSLAVALGLLFVVVTSLVIEHGL